MSDPIRVLYVGDDEIGFARVTTHLEQADEVDEALTVVLESDPKAILDRLATADEPFDCLVSEYAMPNLNGLELLDHVREDHPDLPFILFTSEGSEAIASDAISAGVSDYLTTEGEVDQYEVLANRIANYARKFRAEHELEQVRSRYELAVRAASDVIWEREAGSEMLTLSDGLEPAFGYNPDQERSFEWWIDHIHPEDREVIHVDLQETLAQQREEFSAEYRFRRADGSYAYVLDQGCVVYDGAGEPIRLVGAIRDISDRHARKQALQRKIDRLEGFTSVVSHDIRNPLNVALGHLELTMDEYEDPHLAETARALDRIDELTEDLITIARKGRVVTDPEPVALARAVPDAWACITATDAMLEVESPLDELVILGDPSRVQEVLENLFGNAVSHGGEDVTVTVGPLEYVPKDGPRAASNTPTPTGFYIEDDGPGVPAAEREEVFATGYTTAEDGTGFGLAIVADIVDAHGWEIVLTESEAGGARFEITDVEVVQS
jgi:PAS domain S-box-containing protein